MTDRQRLAKVIMANLVIMTNSAKEKQDLVKKKLAQEKARRRNVRLLTLPLQAAKAKIRAQIEADRKNIAARKLRDSVLPVCSLFAHCHQHARERRHGAQINRFSDIGVDLNAAVALGLSVQRA